MGRSAKELLEVAPWRTGNPVVWLLSGCNFSALLLFFQQPRHGEGR